MASSKFVFPKVISVCQVRIWVNVTGVASKDKHGRFMNDSTVVVPVEKLPFLQFYSLDEILFTLKPND